MIRMLLILMMMMMMLLLMVHDDTDPWDCCGTATTSQCGDGG